MNGSGVGHVPPCYTGLIMAGGGLTQNMRRVQLSVYLLYVTSVIGLLKRAGEYPEKGLFAACHLRRFLSACVRRNCSTSVRFTAGTSRKAGSKGASEPVMSATQAECSAWSGCDTSAKASIISS